MKMQIGRPGVMNKTYQDSWHNPTRNTTSNGSIIGKITSFKT